MTCCKCHLWRGGLCLVPGAAGCVSWLTPGHEAELSPPGLAETSHSVLQSEVTTEWSCCAGTIFPIHFFPFRASVQCEQARCNPRVSVPSLAPATSGQPGLGHLWELETQTRCHPSHFVLCTEECVPHQPCCSSGVGARCCGTGKEPACPK